jgi:hypothetical protein
MNRAVLGLLAAATLSVGGLAVGPPVLSANPSYYRCGALNDVRTTYVWHLKGVGVSMACQWSRAAYAAENGSIARRHPWFACRGTRISLRVVSWGGWRLSLSNGGGALIMTRRSARMWVAAQDFPWACG